MTERSYSYLDVSALDGVREKLAAGEAALVLPATLDEVIWANGPGAGLFGHSGIASFVGNDPELSPASRRQIAATPGFPNIGSGRTIAVRLAKGVSSQTVMFSASAIALPDGERAILLSTPDALAGKRSEQESAARAISGLASNGGGVAIVDANGAVKAASARFGDLGIAAETLAALATEVSREADRMVKRPVPSGKGNLPAGIVRLADEPALSLLMIASDSGDEIEPEETAEAEETTPAPAVTLVTDDSSNPTTQDATAGAVTTAVEQVDAGQDQTGVAPAMEPAGADIQAVEAKDTEAADAPAAGPTGPQPGDEDKWYFNGRDPAPEGGTAENADGGAATPAGATDNEPAETPQNIMGAGPDIAAAPLRFVWRTDADGCFSALSDEFRAAFGPEASDIVGREFAEVAETFGLDPDNEIAGLMKRRDTWSGRSVLWPIAGTDLVAPVDLAALPVYGRDGTFEGFRGFGIARMGDAVVDNDARGLSLTGDLPPEKAAADAPAIAAPDDFTGEDEDPFQGEVPALALDNAPEQHGSDKVIRLAERRVQQQPKGLSSSEQQNFQEIGKRLKEAGTDDDTPEAEASHDANDADVASDVGVATLADDEAPSAEAEMDAVVEAEPVEASEEAATSGGQDQAKAEASAISETDPLASGGDAVTDAADEGEADRDAPDAEQPAVATDAEMDSAPASPDDTESPIEDVLSGTAETVAEADETTAVEAREAEVKPSPAPERTTSERRVPVGLSAFLPSAFSGGGTGDASLGIDSAVLSRLPLPLLIHSGDELHYANREFLTLTGYRSLAEFDLAGGLGAIFAEPYENDGASDQKLKLRTREGGEFPVHAFLQSVGWQGGKALLLALRRADSSERSTPVATDDLETRLAELRTIIDTATDGVVIIDNEGAIRSVSKPAEALFGYDDGDLTGKPFTSLFAIESQRPAREYLDGLAGNGVASVLNDGREVIGREVQGRFIPLFMTIGRLPNESGFCAVLRDITHWKRAEEELTEARAVAERASSQKTEFLARVSHEIRTPLNAIIGFSELMIDEKFGPIGSERYRDYLRDINRSGNHVLDLVNDLLDISKIEAGQQELSYEAVSLNDVLGETVAMMQPQANRERVIIRSSFASKLPDVVADLRSIRQIALNLLSNAIRYTPAGGQVIVSTAYESSGDIAMRVRDTGIGMAAAEIEQALKPFKQVNALKRPRGDGTGLGLPLTKAMVEANRARFVIQSTPGEGTLVEIIFPSQRVLAD
jgi:PAS domain S-box-containing protein